ncbi:Transcription cofactor vestigial-like protein 3 [Vulpes lagopus]
MSCAGLMHHPQPHAAPQRPAAPAPRHAPAPRPGGQVSPRRGRQPAGRGGAGRGGARECAPGTRATSRRPRGAEDARGVRERPAAGGCSVRTRTGKGRGRAVQPGPPWPGSASRCRRSPGPPRGAAVLAPWARLSDSPGRPPWEPGDIGSVVDEHFSRALGQASTLHPESAISKSKMGLTPLWRDSSALSNQRSSFPTSFWTSSYQPPSAPCLGGVHPDFQVTAPPGTFTAADPSPWPGHGLHQTGPAPHRPASESWHYPLASQCDITKTDPTTVTTATSAWAGAFHGTVDLVPSVGFETGLQHQDKNKESPWY